MLLLLNFVQSDLKYSIFNIFIFAHANSNNNKKKFFQFIYFFIKKVFIFIYINIITITHHQKKSECTFWTYRNMDEFTWQTGDDDWCDEWLAHTGERTMNNAKIVQRWVRLYLRYSIDIVNSPTDKNLFLDDVLLIFTLSHVGWFVYAFKIKKKRKKNVEYSK